MSARRHRNARRECMSTESGFDTDILIIGTGPAGAASAAALATYGVRCQAIGKFGWTARTPRAHITNQRPMEILRDLGLEQEAVGMAVPNTQMGENTYCTSLTGTEPIGRASCRERVCQYVSISVVGVSLKKKQQQLQDTNRK